jgi:hypothetical protein
LETLNQLEAKAASSMLTPGSVSAHAAAAPDSHPIGVAAKPNPVGKSESFLADIMGIHFPTESQHSTLAKSFESKKSTLPSSSSDFGLSPLLCILIIALAGMLF